MAIRPSVANAVQLDLFSVIFDFEFFGKGKLTVAWPGVRELEFGMFTYAGRSPIVAEINQDKLVSQFG